MSALVRAGADVVLYAYLPLHLFETVGVGQVGVISLFLAVPAGIRLIAAPVWGRLAGRSGRYTPLILMGLTAYTILLQLMPRVQGVEEGLLLIALSACFTSAFNPVARARLTLGEGERGVVRLAVWHQWESAGYFISGIAFGFLLSDDAPTLKQTTAILVVLFLGCILLVLARLPRQGLRLGSTPRAERRLPMGKGVPAGAILFLFLSSLIWEAVAGTFGLFFTQSLQGTVSAYGATLSGATLIALIAYRPLAHVSRHYDAPFLFTVAAVGYTLMYAMMWSRSPWIAAAAYLMPLNTLVRTGMNALLTEGLAESERGAGMGLMEAVESGAALIGSLLGGLSADWYGLSTVPKIATLLSLLTGVSLWNRLGNRRV